MAGEDWKAMFKAIQDNDFALVEYYLNSGIDPNYQHPEYLALPLAESIRYDHIEIAKLLLDHGANPSIIETETSASSIEIATKFNKPMMIALMNAFI